MSTFQRLTLIGLYNYDDTLFDNLSLPSAYDRQTFLDVLLMEQGEKRVAFPDFDFMKFSIGAWSRKWSESLEKIAAALIAEYNPIQNYDRYEEWTEHEEGDYKNNVKDGGTDSRVNSGTIVTDNTGTSTETTNNMTTERTVSAFNESAYQPDEKNTVNGSVTTTPNTKETVTPNTTERQQYGKTEDGSGDDRRDRRHDAHIYGNIGVTTSQQMIGAEIDLRKDQNMYAIACELFANDLLLMLY